jgi:hypothetical protein
MKRTITLACGAVLSLGLAACGEKAQTAGAKKPDTSPYASATGTHSATGWQVGDSASWERQLAKRAQMGQNEYTRTGSVISESSGSTAPVSAPAAAKP